MSFERSASGQSNRALFLGVDYVCYVEGEDQQEAGDDIAFWKAAIGSLRPDLKVWFTCRGGKPVLEALAHDVVARNVSHTLIAMDADYSRFFPNRLISDRRVLYTYGYSWENDLYYLEHAIDCHARFAKCQAVLQPVIDHYNSSWASFSKQAHWIMNADFLALARKTSAIPRNSPGRIISKSANGVPELDLRQARVLVLEAQRTKSADPPKPYIARPKDPQRDLVGKVIGLAARFIALSALRAHSAIRALSADHFHQMALMVFEAALRSAQSNPVLDHHRAQAAAI